MDQNVSIIWQCKNFGAMSASEMHHLLALRAAVFVVEQKCPYLDPDHKDEHALHVMGWREAELVACSRILPPGVSYDEVSVGRVASAQAVRGTGAGRELMRKTMDYIEAHFGKTDVRISAQSYLKKFYEDFGFVQVSDEYPEDDIPHIEMLYRALQA